MATALVPCEPSTPHCSSLHTLLQPSLAFCTSHGPGSKCVIVTIVSIAAAAAAAAAAEINITVYCELFFLLVLTQLNSKHVLLCCISS